MSGHALPQRLELQPVKVAGKNDEQTYTAPDAMENYGEGMSRRANAELDRRTVRKLDFILLPFLALLFLFNSLDKSNVGNAVLLREKYLLTRIDRKC
jgi:hypothetical protein